jgi:hypothetical protein
MIDCATQDREDQEKPLAQREIQQLEQSRRATSTDHARRAGRVDHAMPEISRIGMVAESKARSTEKRLKRLICSEPESDTSNSIAPKQGHSAVTD